MNLRLLVPLLALLATAAAAQPAAGDADRQFAADKGCFACHGNPPRRNVRSFAEIAGEYARHREQPGADKELAARLRAGSLFSHIAAHERLTEDEAARLVRWLIAGG